jgi:hypothetical protein
LAIFAAIRRAIIALAMRLAAREKRQGQNRLPGLILYEHHQSQIVVDALLSQLSDCVLGIRKCRRLIRQVRAFRIIRDPVLSVYREKISHQTPPFLGLGNAPRFGCKRLPANMIAEPPPLFPIRRTS